MIQPGSRLAHYEIVSALGKGGMGEVWRARDTKLGREVAIKTLPAEFAQDADRLARFEREAKLLASLNHPNIAAIYGLEEHEGSRFLVLELVEGPTLADRIAQGAIRAGEALQFALQVAQALEVAHQRGVIHRDLKPANIKLTEDGQVKVLDFGLAKALEPEAVDSDVANSPTLSMQATQQGIILGTAAYMSPEQAKGRGADRRSDVWAFGCVLYEMLTGRQVFAAEDVSTILARVLDRDPDFAELPAQLDPRITKLLDRCLQKDARRRYHDIADVRLDVEDIIANTGGTVFEAESQAAAGIRLVLRWALPALVLGALAGGSAVWVLEPPGGTSVAEIVRMTIPLPPGEVFVTGGGVIPPLAVSPDGRSLAYEIGGQIWLRDTDRLESSPIAGTDGGSAPFFSPEGNWIGFFAQGTLKTAAIGGGGVAQTLCDAPVGMGGSWGPDDTIYFAPYNTSGIWRVPASGGACEEVTTVDRGQGEVSHRWPQALPEGRGVLFTVWTGPGSDEKHVDAHVFDGSERHRLVSGADTGHWAPSGHLVYSRAGMLTAVEFDLSALEVRGSPVALGVQVMQMEGAAYALSSGGTLAYITENLVDRQLVWVDRTGSAEPIPAPPRRYEDARLSPDGLRAAVTIRGPTWGVWTYDLDRPSLTPLAPNLGSSQWAQWSPDSARIVYRGTRNGFRNLYSIAADGSGGEQRLTEGENLQQATAISPDGQWLLFDEVDPLTGTDIWLMPLDGTSDAQPLLAEEFSESDAQISPDGNWLAYESDRSGFDEIYVQPFPGPGGRIPVSGTEGGIDPLWSRDGRELFYLDGNKMMSVSFSQDPSLSIGTPEVLYEGRFASYDVAADGRFLRIQPTGPEEPATQFHVVIHWLRELSEQVPVD